MLGARRSLAFSHLLLLLPTPNTRSSVSYPPPAYYAHLAAARARMLLDVDDTASFSSMTSAGGRSAGSGGSGGSGGGMAPVVALHDNYVRQGRMFYV